jgi:hypothetical protein
MKMYARSLFLSASIFLGVAGALVPSSSQAFFGYSGENEIRRANDLNVMLEQLANDQNFQYQRHQINSSSNRELSNELNQLLRYAFRESRSGDIALARQRAYERQLSHACFSLDNGAACAKLVEIEYMKTQRAIELDCLYRTSLTSCYR